MISRHPPFLKDKKTDYNKQMLNREKKRSNVKYTLHAYKFSLSGALTLLLERRSGSTRGGSAVEYGDTNSAGTEVDTAPSALLALFRLELSSETSAGSSSLCN